MATSLHLHLTGAVIIMTSCIFGLMFLVFISSASHNIDPSCSMKTTDSIRHVARADNRTLRVVVPWKVGFEQFVQFRNHSCMVDGFSVQLFLQAVHRMGPLAPPFEFVLHGDGTVTPPYDDLVGLTASGTVDAVVADLTITSDRMERVDFTMPYLPSTLVMVTPFRYGSAGTLWDFLKPFSWQLWLTLLGSFVATGIAIYLLEDRNPDFHVTTTPTESVHTIKHPTHQSDCSNHICSTVTPSRDATLPTTNGAISVVASPSHPSSLHRQGPPIYDEASHLRRIMNAYWFSSLCVLAAQQESVRTHLGRIVTVIWLFVMLIFNSSYTASMASLLSAQKSYPTIKDFEALLNDANIKVGYQEGSFMKSYMKKLHIEPQRLVDCRSEMDFAQALHDGINYRKGAGGTAAGVGAVLDELPYIQILLQYQCDFTKTFDVLHLPTFGGLGFAFAKESPWTDQFSKMILAMAEDGSLQVLKDGWRIDDNRSRCSAAGPSHLRLRSFGGLLSILGLVYISSVLWRLLTRAHAHYVSAEDMSFSLSCTSSPINITNVLCMCRAQDDSIIRREAGGAGGGASFGPFSRRSNRVGSDETMSTVL